MAKTIDNWSTAPGGKAAPAVIPRLPPVPKSLLEMAGDSKALEAGIKGYARACVELDRVKRAQVAAPVAWMMRNTVNTGLPPRLLWEPATDWHITWEAVPLYATPSVAAPVAPAGWKMAPNEPTKEMLREAFNRFELPPIPGYPSGNDARRAIYLAMLEAAPLYAGAPPVAAPVALTDAQIDELIQQHVDPVATYNGLHRFARAILSAAEQEKTK